MKEPALCVRVRTASIRRCWLDSSVTALCHISSFLYSSTSIPDSHLSSALFEHSLRCISRPHPHEQLTMPGAWVKQSGLEASRSGKCRRTRRPECLTPTAPMLRSEIERVTLCMAAAWSAQRGAEGYLKYLDSGLRRGLSAAGRRPPSSLSLCHLPLQPLIRSLTQTNRP